MVCLWICAGSDFYGLPLDLCGKATFMVCLWICAGSDFYGLPLDLCGKRLLWFASGFVREATFMVCLWICAGSILQHFLPNPRFLPTRQIFTVKVPYFQE